ncbi:MAG: hypothetical protein ACYDEI_00290 [Erysipelotrichaceae bacterium]
MSIDLTEKEFFKIWDSTSYLISYNAALYKAKQEGWIKKSAMDEWNEIKDKFLNHSANLYPYFQDSIDNIINKACAAIEELQESKE